MFIWYIAACLSLVTLGCWLGLDFIDIRDARRNGQHVAWWKTRGIRSNLGMLVLTFVFLFFGIFFGIFEIGGMTIYIAITICIFLIIMLLTSTFVLYIRLQSSRKQLNVQRAEGSQEGENRKKDEWVE
jgi:hypothetical protein